MLSSETIEQFLKDIHGEDGKTVLLIFADYLEENGVDCNLRNRRVKYVCHNLSNCYGPDIDFGSGNGYGFGYGGYGCGYGYGVGIGVGYGCCYTHGDGIGIGYGYDT